MLRRLYVVKEKVANLFRHHDTKSYKAVIEFMNIININYIPFGYYYHYYIIYWLPIDAYCLPMTTLVMGWILAL